MTNENYEIFLPYQKEWLEDRSPLKIIEKNRRCGISWTDAADAVIDAAPSKGWANTYYMSFNKDNCRQYIEDAGEWAKKFGEAASEIEVREEPLLEDDEKSITTFRITFASGAEIVGLPGVPRSLRSKQGNVVLDEVAFFDDFEGVMKAALALVMWGGRIRIISTHNGDSSPFNQLIKDIKSGKNQEWSLHRITFREAVGQGLFRRICLKKGDPWTQEAEDDFVEKMYRIYGDNADEELDVIPRASGGRYFSRGLLDYCTAEGDAVAIRRLECSDSFLHKSDFIKTKQVKDFFSREIRPLLAVCKSPVFFGNDFGRSCDLSTYWFTREETKTSLSTFMLVELKNVPFEQQQLFSDLVTDFLDERRILGGGAMDSRGNGQQIAEHASLRHPGAIVAVMETNAWYAKYGAELHGLMESRDFTVPDDDVSKGDFALVVLKNGIPTIPALRTEDRDRKGLRHGDCASAAMLCVCAWRECAAEPAPFFSFCRKKPMW